MTTINFRCTYTYSNVCQFGYCL